jgi:hypothetical protein
VSGRPAYARKAAIERAVETFRGLGLDVGGYELKPDGTIRVFAPRQANDDDFDTAWKERT